MNMKLAEFCSLYDIDPQYPDRFSARVHVTKSDPVATFDLFHLDDYAVWSASGPPYLLIKRQDASQVAERHAPYAISLDDPLLAQIIDGDDRMRVWLNLSRPACVCCGRAWLGGEVQDPHWWVDQVLLNDAYGYNRPFVETDIRCPDCW